MKSDTWIEQMIKEIEKEKQPEKKETPEVKLSESDMNTLADIMIKKMSDENFDVEKEKQDKKDPEPETKPELDKGEESID